MLTSKNVSKLPDAFDKRQDSNNAKMLALNEGNISILQQVFEQLHDSLDIYKATGKTLDLYGEAVGQKRGGLNDTKFRFLILSKVAVNTSGVDYETIMDNLIHILGCKYEDVKIIEMQDHAEPATVKMVAMPFEILGRAGFTSRQAAQIVKLLLPISVNLIFDELQGTFEFAAQDNDYDEGKGFGNVEQTIGGTLSMLVGEDEEKPLPI